MNTNPQAETHQHTTANKYYTRMEKNHKINEDKNKTVFDEIRSEIILER